MVKLMKKMKVIMKMRSKRYLNPLKKRKLRKKNQQRKKRMLSMTGRTLMPMKSHQRLLRRI
jgi:hypothetical protein